MNKGNTFDASKYDLQNSIATSSSKVTVQISSTEPLAISLYNGNSRSWLAKDTSGNPPLESNRHFSPLK